MAHACHVNGQSLHSLALACGAPPSSIAPVPRPHTQIRQGAHDRGGPDHPVRTQRAGATAAWRFAAAVLPAARGTRLGLAALPLCLFSYASSLLWTSLHASWSWQKIAAASCPGTGMGSPMSPRCCSSPPWPSSRMHKLHCMAMATSTHAHRAARPSHTKRVLPLCLGSSDLAGKTLWGTSLAAGRAATPARGPSSQDLTATPFPWLVGGSGPNNGPTRDPSYAQGAERAAGGEEEG